MIGKLRFIVLQTILAAVLAALFFNGTLHHVAEGHTPYFVGFVLCVCVAGLWCIWAGRYGTASWISALLVRIGVIGMQIGAVGAMGGLAASMAGGDPAAVIAAFIGSIGTAFQVSVAALASNIWLDVTLRFAGED